MDKHSSSFTQRVLKNVRAIPKGSIMTYKQIATLAGNPQAFRAVGSIMKKNHDFSVPCHRVIRTNGFVGEYNNGGSEAKLQKLIEEGVLF